MPFSERKSKSDSESAFGNVIFILFANLWNGCPFNLHPKFNNLDINKQYYVMMGITSEVSKLKWIVAGTVVGAGIVAGAVIWAPASVVILFSLKGILLTSAGAVAGGVGGDLYVANFAEGESGNDYLKPTIIEAKSDVFKGLKCEEVTTYS